MHFNNATQYFKLIDKCLIIYLIDFVKFKEQRYLNNKNIKCK